MGEWPDGWFRDGEESEAAGEAGAADNTVSIPAGGDYQSAAGQYSAKRQTAWPAQPPISSARGDWDTAPDGVAAPPDTPTTAPGSPRWRGPRLRGWRGWLRPRRVVTVIVVLIALLLAGTVGMYAYLNSKINRASILVNYPGRPAVGAGTNWLIAGSDSRQGLTVAQEREFVTGFGITGGRSDTIMLLHIPSNGGRPVLISIPRDSYVHIPGYGYNKINASFAFGGPKLLAETVQDATGLYISHFMDIGFGGFVRVVNDVGGVRMCLRTPLKDAASGVNLKAGCQTLTGGQALAYVRDRHNFATQDLQREQDQRIFLKALLQKMTSTGTMLNPFAILPASVGVVDSLTVDQGTSLLDLYGAAKALRDPITTTVPIANANYITSAGDSVLWSTQAQQLWKALRTDTKIPKYLITGSTQA
jgi:LCP family protein required for cell wall assembly